MYTGSMVRRVFLLVILLLGQSAMASTPLACAEPVEEPPCHGEMLAAPQADLVCEMLCAMAGPGMVAVPGLQLAPPSFSEPAAARVPAFELPPVEEIYHPPIAL